MNSKRIILLIIHTCWPLMRLLLLRLMHSQLIHIKMESIQIDRCFETPSLQIFSVPKDSVIWDCLLLLLLCFEKTKKLSVCGVGSHYTSLLRSFPMFISYQVKNLSKHFICCNIRLGREYLRKNNLKIIILNDSSLC